MITPIKEFAAMVHSSETKFKALAMFRAYFDESGTHNGSLVTSIGGFIGTAQAWTDLEGPWRALLAEFEELGVKTFHMTDFLAQTGEFSRMEGPFRSRLITQMSNLLAEADVTPISSEVVCEDWDRVVKDKEFLDQFPKPFFLCFEDVIRQLWEWSARNCNGEDVAPVFAHNPEYHERMDSVGKFLAGTDWYPRFLSTISFGTPQKLIPLQAADFAVHLMREDVIHRAYAPGTGLCRVVFNTATQGQVPIGHWFDADGLELTVRRFKETGEIYPLEG